MMNGRMSMVNNKNNNNNNNCDLFSLLWQSVARLNSAREMPPKSNYKRRADDDDAEEE